MNKTFIINEMDVLEVYKIEGKLREYKNCIDYLKFKKTRIKNSIRQISQKLKIKYGTALYWARGDRVPIGIKAITFLKEKSILPYYPNEKVARIVGFLHGDGYLLNSIASFGFVSKDKKMLIKLKNDVETEFKIKGKLKIKRSKGDIETIHNKKFLVKYPTYSVEFNSKAVSSILFRLGVPRGKKMYQKTFVPGWVMNSNNKIQKAFLQGLFDSELCNSTISTYKGHKDDLSSPRMEMGKVKNLENNLRGYLLQISKLLENFDINSKIVKLREYAKNKISLTLSINNKLSNIYNFVTRVGFYYNKGRISKSLKVKELALEKIKNKNSLYKVLKYCEIKSCFTMQDLEKDLNLPRSSTKLLGFYLYKNRLANRKRKDRGWFEYYPDLNKINKIIENPLSLETLPRLLE